MEEQYIPQADTWSDRIMSYPEVQVITGLGRSTLWRLENAGQFPKRFNVSRGMVGWRKSDIEKWMAELGK